MPKAIDTITEPEEAVKKRKQTDEERREKGRACSRAWKLSNRERYTATAKAYNAANREKQNAGMKAYKKAHHEAISAYNKAYRETHREEINAYEKVYKDANRVKTSVRMKAIYASNRASMCAKSKAWALANPEKLKARQKAYREANKEKRSAYIKAYCNARHKAHPEIARAHNRKRRALKRGAPVGDIAAITAWEKSWKRLKRVICHWCNSHFPPKRCHTDHVIPLSKGGAHSLDNLVVACSGCNLSKSAKLPAEWNKQLTEPVLL